MLKLIYGKAKSGKTDLIIKEIKNRVEQGEKRVLLIVPEQFSHEAERELCKTCGDAMSLSAEVISFTRLYRRVMDMVGGGREFMDKSGRVLALNRALSEISSRLKVYNYAQTRTEMQTMLLHSLTELKLANITEEMLSEAAERDNDTLHEKLGDLSLILSAYNAVTSHSEFDPADRMFFLAENIKKLKKHSFSAVYIDGFIDFTAGEREIISALVDVADDVTIALTIDDLYEENEVFDFSRKTAIWLTKLAENKNLSLVQERLEGEKSGKSVDVLREYLFGFPAEKFENNGILLKKCSNIAEECEFAAAKCRELVQSGSRYKDIVIAMRGFGDYRPTMECVFERYGVPMYAAVRSDIMQKPLPLLVSSAIDAVSHGYMYDDVFAYLKTGLTGIELEQIDLLENYCITWSVAGKVWEKDFEMHPEGYNRDFDEQSLDELKNINKIRKKVITPLIKLKNNAEIEGTATNMARSLNSFFADIKLPEALQNHAELLNNNSQEQRAAEYEQLWALIAKSLEQVHGVLGEMKLDFETFGKVFRLMLSQCDVGSIPVSLDRVTIGEIDRVRRRKIKHLILLGASDQKMPMISEENAVFSADERRELCELGFEIGRTVEDDLSREMNAIYNCIALPNETIAISYCPSDENNTVAMPSFVMTRAQALFEAEIDDINREDLQSFAKRPAMQLAVKTGGYASELSVAAQKYFESTKENEKLENARKSAKISRGSLSRKSVNELYGRDIRLSASRTDKFSACRFAFFLQYGLRAKPRQQAGFNPPEMGSFVHYILENVAKELKNSGGFANCDRAKSDKITNKYVAIYVKNELNDFRDKTKRFSYLFNRLSKSVREIVWDMVAELAKSKFEPLDFELSFSSNDDMSVMIGDTEDNRAEIIGTADRVDGWLNNGKLHLRVMDYKTGKKSFDLSDIWYGMNMQMLMYLFALERQGEGRYGSEIVPTGVLYVPANDGICKTDGSLPDDEIILEKLKSKKRSGLLINDSDVLKAMENSEEPCYIPVKYKKEIPSGDALASAEQLGKLSRHIENTLKNLAGELRSGSILADPFYRNEQENACLYCDYFDACYFSEKSDCRRYLTKLRPAEVWKNIQEKEQENG